MFIRSVVRNAAAEGDAGGSGAPAPAAQPPATQEPAKAPPQTFEELKARTAGELKARISAQKAAQAAEDRGEPEPAEPAKDANQAKIDAAPTNAAEKAARAIDAKGEQVPEQKPGESDERYTLRLAKMAQDLKDMEVTARRERTGRETAEKKAIELERKVAEFEDASKKLEQRLARGKSLEEALEFLYDETGFTLEDLVRGVNDNKTRIPGSRAKLPPEVTQRLEAAEKAAKEAAEKAAALERQHKEKEEALTKQQEQDRQGQTYNEHITQAGKFLEENADRFPLLAKMGWAQQVVHNAYQRVKAQTPLEAVEKGATLESSAAAIEDSLAENTIALLDDERAMKALEKRNPELAKKLSGRYGVAVRAPAPPPRQEPRAVSKVSSEATTPPARSGESREEAKARAAAALSVRLREQREAH